MVQDREGLGRSRGGVTTKIHLAADGQCRPVSRVVSAGQRHDALAFAAVLADVHIRRPRGGRPRTRPDGVLADKAYSSSRIRKLLRRRGIKATIPEPSNQVNGRLSKGSNGGRPPEFDTVKYKDHNTTERAFNRLRGYRSVATRYDKREFVYRGTIDVASIGIWLRHPPENDPRDTPLVTREVRHSYPPAVPARPRSRPETSDRADRRPSPSRRCSQRAASGEPCAATVGAGSWLFS